MTPSGLALFFQAGLITQVFVDPSAVVAVVYSRGLRVGATLMSLVLLPSLQIGEHSGPLKHATLLFDLA